MIRSCRQLLRGTLTAILLTHVSHSCLTLADDGFPPQSMIVRPFSDGGVVPDSPQFPGASVGGTADFPVWPQLDAAPFSSSSQFPLHGNGIDEQWSQANWADTSWDWHFLPKGLLYQSYVAGEKEPRFSNAVLSESGGQTQWDSTLGWRLGLVRFGTARGTQPEGVQLDLEGGTFLRVLPNQGNDLQSIDFRAGIPLTWREGPFQAKVAAYHIESHVGDDFLVKHPGFVPNNYDRTAVVFGLGYFVFDSLRLYSEVGWGISGSANDKPFEWQSGLEWSNPHATGLRGAPYFAANVHLREVTHGSGSVNVVAGWQWRRRQSDHVFRVGLQYFSGKNNQYSFLQENQQLFGFGARYDY